MPVDVVVRAGLTEGRTLDRAALRLLRRELRKAEALQVATRALRSRDLSRRRLAERLERAAVPPAAAAESLGTLERAGIVDDRRVARLRAQALATYREYFRSHYDGSREPVVFAHHFEDWNGGIYMRAVDQVVKNVCTKKGVKCVSFKELADWLDVQKPETLARLRGLDPAQSPAWSTVVK